MEKIETETNKNLEKEWAETFSKCIQLGYQRDEFSWKKLSSSRNGCPEDQATERDLQLKNYLADLQRIKQDLNDTKNSLNGYDIRIWRQHTGLTNKCGLIVKKLRTVLNPEFCTQAWVKFCTLLHMFDLIKPEVDKEACINTAHLCEAPGAFVACLNHIISSHHSKLNWEWLAVSLNPYFEGNQLGPMIDDDRFIRETFEHWDFGVDLTGDLMNWDNVVHLMQRCQSVGNMDLVTGDGSIDCSDNPSEQELAVAPLLYWEVLTSVLILSPGGSLVLKAFTTFEPFTISLFYVLCCSFEEVHVCKPGPSKPGNSEVYLICKKYRGLKTLDEEMIKTLMSRREATNPAETPLIELENIPFEFLDRVKNSSQFFANHQMNAIQKNIALFGKVTKSFKKRIKITQNYIAEEFMRRFKLSALDSKYHLTSVAMKRSLGINEVYDKHTNVSFQSGSFSERMEKRKRTWIERVFDEGGQKSECRPLPNLLSVQSNIQWYKSTGTKPPSRHEVEFWSPVIGRKIDKLRNSKFCSSVSLHDLFEAREYAVVLKEENSAVLNSIRIDILDQGDLHFDCNELAMLDSTLNLFPRKENITVLNTNRTTEHEYDRLDDSCENIKALSRKVNHGTQIVKSGKTYSLDTLVSGCNSLESDTSTFEGAISQYSDCPDKSSPKQGISCRDNEIKICSGNISLSNFFESDGVNSKCSNSGLTWEKYDVIIGPMVTNVLRTGSIRNMFHILFQFTIISTVLDHHGAYLFTIGDILTNFDVGIIYIFARLFDKMCIFNRFMTQSGKVLKLVVCQGFQGCPRHVEAYAKQVYTELLRTHSDGGDKDVLQIVPMKKILQDDFLGYLTQVNEESASSEISLIKKLEMEFQKRTRNLDYDSENRA